MQIIIYTSQINPRILFSVKLIFETILGVDYILTQNKNEFCNSGLPKLNYSDQPFADELFIKPHPLLFEKGIKPQEISVFEWLGVKAFFKTNEKNEIPFDIFAAGFFLVIRYEEYLPTPRDNHQRFEATESVAYKKDFLQDPVVNQWAWILSDILNKKHVNFFIPQKIYRYIPTIDIDNAFAYLNKGFFRSAGALIKSAVSLNFSEFSDRICVLSGIMKDSYDTYDLLDKLHEKYNIKPIYFFLIGRYGKNDKNIPPGNVSFQNLIKKIAIKYPIGIHPSYGSNLERASLKTEIDTLSNIINNNITKSRQHFLILSFPDTYRMLLKNNIYEDYTMGYASHPGFRAGICTPFPFYDLPDETETKLMIYPFPVMDATFTEYMHLSPAEAAGQIMEIIEKVKKVNGVFVSLWHNESLSEKGKWKDWRHIYEKMLEYAV
ncbi:MAG: polysaccharide deacetylase family protein [Bacteroidia bacterium]|nr:polysaccharide deacetylase family protein [Bacteroidia bacterium]